MQNKHHTAQVKNLEGWSVDDIYKTTSFPMRICKEMFRLIKNKKFIS